VKLFTWLALRGRIWTADRRRRHGLQADDSCALCDQEVEIADHLLLSCVFAREVWDRLLRRCHIRLQLPVGAPPFVDWWLSSRKRLPKGLRRGFDSLALLVGWSLWKERNRRVFDAAASSVAEVVRVVVAEAELWVAAGFKPLAALVAPAARE